MASLFLNVRSVFLYSSNESNSIQARERGECVCVAVGEGMVIVDPLMDDGLFSGNDVDCEGCCVGFLVVILFFGNDIVCALSFSGVDEVGVLPFPQEQSDKSMTATTDNIVKWTFNRIILSENELLQLGYKSQIVASIV